MRPSWLRELPVPAGFGFPLGFAAGIVVTLIGVAAGATSHPGWLLAALAAVVAVVSGVSTVPAALGSAVTSWCLLDGFVLGRYGQLVFTVDAGRDAMILAGAAFTIIAVRTLKGTFAPSDTTKVPLTTQDGSEVSLTPPRSLRPG